MLHSLIHRPAEQDLRELSALLDAPCFDLTSHGSDHQSLQRCVYEQLRIVNRWAGGGSALIADRKRLFGTLSFAATVSPALFHVAQAHYGVCLSTIKTLGAPSAELDHIVAGLDSMESVAAILITEVGVGCSHFSIETRAVFDPATKEFVIDTPNAGACKLTANVALDGSAKTGVVYAQLWSGDKCHGLFPFVVPLRNNRAVHQGIRIKPLDGDSALRMDYAMISFDGVRVPLANWLRDSASIDDQGVVTDPLGGSDQRLFRSLCAIGNAFTAGTVAAAAVARACVWTAVRYARQRKTAARMGTGRSLIEFRNQQHQLFTALAEAIVISNLAREIVDGDLAGTTASTVSTIPWAAISKMPSLAKVAAIAGAADVVRNCRRACGMHGALGANRFRGYEDLAIAYGSAGGDNQLILIELGRELASSDERSRTGEEAPAALAGPESLRQLARWEERRQYNRARAGLATLPLEAHADLFSTWNARLPALIDLGLTHARRVALEWLLAQQPAGQQGEIVFALATIYALTHFGASRPYDECDRMLAQAYDVIAQHLDALLASFELSPDMIDAPMAQDDYVDAYVSQ